MLTSLRASSLALALLIGPTLHAPAAELKAGTALVDVTPEKFPVVVNGMFNSRSASGALDKLHARCLVLDDGTTRLAICVVDSCMMPRELLDRAKAAASKPSGIPVENMCISATHTHSAPAAMGCLGTDADPVYPAFLETRIARAITLAAKDLKPARAGWAVTRDGERGTGTSPIVRCQRPARRFIAATNLPFSHAFRHTVSRATHPRRVREATRSDGH